MAICGVCRWVLVVFGSTQQKKSPKKIPGVSRLVRVWGTKKKVAQKMNHADHQNGGQPPVRLAPSVHFFSSKNPPIRRPEVELALAAGRSGAEPVRHWCGSRAERVRNAGGTPAERRRICGAASSGWP